MRINLRSTGKAELGWHAYCLSLMPRELLGSAQMLVLGRHSEWIERFLTSRRLYSRCDIVGFAPSTRHEESARNGQLRVLSGTLGSAQLPAQAYDAIWSDSSLFGVRDLRRISEQIARALKPDGLFFANEYVGPGQLEIGWAQREAIAAAYSLIPRRFRSRRSSVSIQRLLDQNRRGSLQNGGPSGMPPENILEVLRDHFQLLQCRALGGTILQFVLREIAGNFRSGEPSATAVLDMLFAIEDALVDSGELPSDFVMIVGSAKQTIN